MQVNCTPILCDKAPRTLQAQYSTCPLCVSKVRCKASHSAELLLWEVLFYWEVLPLLCVYLQAPTRFSCADLAYICQYPSESKYTISTWYGSTTFVCHINSLPALPEFQVARQSQNFWLTSLIFHANQHRHRSGTSRNNLINSISTKKAKDFCKKARENEKMHFPSNPILYIYSTFQHKMLHKVL